jgi:DNA-binding transcriptional LysR family regulator
MSWIDRIGRRLQPRDLHIFLAVSESGSMAKAAERLACSRPVISKAIAELEGTLGVRLFDRTLKGIEHTRYGLALLRRSTSLFDELRQAVNEIDQLLDPNAGELRIGCIETMMAGIGAAAIDRLLQKYPRLRVQTLTGAGPAQLQWLRERKCEVVLGREVADDVDPEIEAEVLYHERLLVVAGAGSKLARRARVSLADVVNESWILAHHEAQPEGPAFEAFISLGLPLPNISIVSDSLALRYRLVATGRFLTMVPASVFTVGSKPSTLRVLPIDIQSSRKSRILATLKGRALSPAASAFIEQVRILAEPLIERTNVQSRQAVASVRNRGAKRPRSDLRTRADMGR